MVEWMAETFAANGQSSERSRERVKRLTIKPTNLQILQRGRKVVEIKLKFRV